MPDKNKLGFTLAEVLLTLTIVGIISSMVIPGLIQDTQNAELKTALKKEYGSLSQVTNLLISDYSIPSTDAASLMDGFGNYLNVAKKCTGTDYSCWHLAGYWKTVANVPITSGLNYTPAYILNDGSLVSWFNYSGGVCFSLNQAAVGTSICNVIVFDINGFKGPNKVGYDIYAATVFKNKLVPNGPTTDYNDCNRSSTSSSNTSAGYGCSSKAITGESY
ncbi:MAG: type II secretion system protein [Candidatus Gastranaerophilales bacterium]|nr:type II secretion system protein [Candidatus Gastranaerophilales bacterium]